MAKYRYVTVLEAQSDGKPPNDNITEGQKILKAGKHETDTVEYITDDGGIDSVTYTAVEVFESDELMIESQAHEFGKDRWFDE